MLVDVVAVLVDDVAVMVYIIKAVLIEVVAVLTDDAAALVDAVGGQYCIMLWPCWLIVYVLVDIVTMLVDVVVVCYLWQFCLGGVAV
jgi:hypothetical protein